MRERMRAWLARAFLLSLPLVPTAILWQIPVHTTVWPIGAVHNAGAATIDPIMVVVGCGLGFVLSIVLLFAAMFAIGGTMKYVWCVAWRKPHYSLPVEVGIQFHGETNATRGHDKIVPKKPQPLIRGRIGAR